MPKVRDLKHMKDRICAVIETVMPYRLSQILEEAGYRLDICKATNGAHVEIY
jgi:hypothetical protein